MALAGGGCSSNSDSGAAGAGGAGDIGTSKESLKVFSWWTGPGEAEALQALVTTYKGKYKGAQVSLDPNVTAATWRPALTAGIDESPTPWDVFQLAAADLPQFVADHPGALANVDKYYAEPSLKSSVNPEILKRVTVDGHQYGVVTGVHRNNSFLWNQQLLKDNKLAVPTTMPEFLAVCEKLKAKGVYPVATTFQTWALHIMFDEILAGTLGAADFDDFVQGRNPPSAYKDGIQSAIDTFAKVLKDYVDPASATNADYGWTQAADDLFNGKAAMIMHGDWAKGYVVNLGWTPGVDFGVSGPPGANDLFVFGADMMGVPAAAPHAALSDAFLGVVASKEGQIAFNRYKGATPMRNDVRDDLDEPGKASLDSLTNAKVLSPSHANSAWDDAIGAFAKDMDTAALLDVYLTAAP